jgi:microcystin-dependent protein
MGGIVPLGDPAHGLRVRAEGVGAVQRSAPPFNQNQALFSLLGTTVRGDGRVIVALTNL